jgi:hypothetical protein
MQTDILDLFLALSEVEFPNDPGHLDILAFKQVSYRVCVCVNSVRIFWHRLISRVKSCHIG